MNIKLRQKMVKLVTHDKKNYAKLLKALVTGSLSHNKIDYLILDAGLKSDCFLNINEFQQNNLEVPIIGTELEINLIGFDKLLNRYYASLAKSKRVRVGKNVKKLFYSKNIIQARVTEVCDTFCKIITLNEAENISGITDKIDNINVDSIIFVRLDKMPKNESDPLHFEILFSNKINIGDIIECTVKNIKDFSVFVSIDDTNLYGVIHNSDLPEDKLENGSLIKRANYKIDDKIRAKVIKIIKNKIILGVKQLDKEIQELVVGNIYKGQIVDIKPFGFIIHLPNGQCGLLHNKEFTWNVQKKPVIGDIISCLVIEINPDKNGIYLTAKKVLTDAAIDYMRSLKIGDTVEGIILNKKENYLFVRLGDQVDGILHVSEIDWDLVKAKEKLRLLQSGDTIKVKIIDINIEKSKILLSLKKLDTSNRKMNQFSGLIIGNIYDCTVKFISYSGVSVSIPKVNIDGFIDKNNLGSNKLKVGDVVKAELTNIDYKKKAFYLSISNIEKANNRRILNEFNESKDANYSAAATFGDLLEGGY